MALAWAGVSQSSLVEPNRACRKTNAYCAPRGRIPQIPRSGHGTSMVAPRRGRRETPRGPVSTPSIDRHRSKRKAREKATATMSRKAPVMSAAVTNGPAGGSARRPSSTKTNAPIPDPTTPANMIAAPAQSCWGLYWEWTPLRRDHHRSAAVLDPKTADGSTANPLSASISRTKAARPRLLPRSSHILPSRAILGARSATHLAH